MSDTLAWWLSFAASRAACVVETPLRADVLDAVMLAFHRGCGGHGEVRATFVPAAKLAETVPRHLWYRLRTVAEWKAAGVDAAIDAVPPGHEPCPLCIAGMAGASSVRH